MMVIINIRKSLLFSVVLIWIGLCLVGSVSAISFDKYSNIHTVSSHETNNIVPNTIIGSLVKRMDFLFFLDFFVFPKLINGDSVPSSVGFSLEDAVRNSSDNDVINIPTNLSTVNNVICINHNLTIRGVDGLTLCDLNMLDGLFVIAPNCTLNLSNIKVSDEYLSSSLIRNNGELILNNCLFENNDGHVDGLIINNIFNSSLLINNSSFIDNNADDTSKGGCINMNYSNGGNISNSIFSGNHGYLGGALYCDLYDNDLLNIVNSSLYNNTGFKGGAVYNKDSHLIIKNSSFRSNNATISGGGLFNDNSDDLEILDCDFHDNNALCGGGVYATTAVNSVGHSNFSYNHALSGGAIYNKDGGKQTYVYNRTQFIGNGYDGVGSYGGAITINNGDLVLTRSILNNNTAEKGGAVYIDSSNLRFEDCLFNDNTGLGYGGVLYSENSHALIRGTVFNHSTATIGGVIYSDGGSITCDDDKYKSEFRSNSARLDGGAIFTLGDLVVSGGDEMTDFIDNNANGSGGAISSRSNLCIEKANFQSNSAGDKGGAIRSSGLVTSDGSSIKILSVNFTDNNANQGSGMFLYEGSYAKVDNCKFTGSAFYNARGSHVLLNNTRFMVNGGWSVYHESGNDLTIRNVIINNNKAEIGMIGCPNDWYRGEIHIINE
ncbi:MAG: hypothetical protein LBT10_00205 [Methanobrevibacter sp.]|nr:hypothetical protein [Methanobrevibacter sp.]